MSVVLVGPLASLAVAQLRPAVPAASPPGRRHDRRRPRRGQSAHRGGHHPLLHAGAPGDPYNPDRVDRSLKTLYATGLFNDVPIDRVGSALVVNVKENPIVNRIAFEGNHKLNDDTLRAAMQLRPRAVFTPAMAEADRQRILDLYAAQGRFAARVEPKIIELPQNRVNVVFEINDGPTR